MITIVAGFGRCGSSLLMQMLEAGGMPVTGHYPAFEPEETGVVVRGGTIDPRWLASIPGHAIKVLDPQKGHIPKGDYRAIWCKRDPKQQARSQIKLLHILGIPAHERGLVKAFARSYERDQPKAWRKLHAAGVTRILEVEFEKIIAQPLEEARQIAGYCGGLDFEKMAAVVRSRPPECAPGMDLEFALLRERKSIGISKIV